MKIYLIRHSETQANKEKKYLGISGSPFTEKGVYQNEENINKLSKVDLDAIYTSSSTRCLTVANKLGKKISINPIVDDNLKEINFGIFENLTWQDAKENYSDKFKKWCEDPYEYRIPNGESQKDLDTRVDFFINEVIKSNYNNAAIFSHGGTIMSMLSNLLRLEPSQKWHFKIMPGSVITIEIKDNFAYLIL